MCSVPRSTHAPSLSEDKETAQETAQLAKSNAQGDFRSAAGSRRKNRRTPPLLVERATESTLGGGKDLVEQHIQEKLKSYAAEILPGVDKALGGAIIVELGMDMTVFESVSEPAFGRKFVWAATIGAYLLIGTLLVYEAWPNLPRKMGLSLATVVPDASSRIMPALQ